MTGDEQRVIFGARAIGILSALAMTGVLDKFPANRTDVLKLVADWDGTFKEKADEPATNA